MSFRRDFLESDLQDHTRVSVYVFTPESSDEPKLEKVGEWRAEGCAGVVSCHKHDNGGSGSIEINQVYSLQSSLLHARICRFTSTDGVA